MPNDFQVSERNVMLTLAEHAAVIRDLQAGAVTYAQVKQMIGDLESISDAESNLMCESTDRKIESLKQQHDKQIAELRDKLALSMTAERLEKSLETVIWSLRPRIARDEKSRSEKRRKICVLDEYAPTRMAVLEALQSLVESVMAVTPLQVITGKPCELTSQPLRALLEEDATNAKVAVTWLQEFIKQWEAL